MESKVKFNIENVDITEIMKQLHKNLKSRGYDLNEMKQLKGGAAVSTTGSLHSISERLEHNLAEANSTQTVHYWWRMPSRGAKTFIKKIMRKLNFFYLKHVTDQQVIFNANAVQSMNTLAEYCRRLEQEKTSLSSKIDSIQRANKELIYKLGKLDISEENGFSEKLNYDYASFEEKFRGGFSDIKERQKNYLDYFKNCENVIDIGCGRGEFLSILKENNIPAVGIDLVKKNVETCLENGLDAVFGNGVDYLEGLDKESVDGIFSAQVIEHMKTEVLIKLVNTAFEQLKSGGIVVLETLNPQCLMIYAECLYLDPTHSTPVHPETVKFFMQKAGFEDIEIKYLSPTDKSYLLPHFADHPEADRSIDMINHLLFGNREYAIIARK